MSILDELRRRGITVTATEGGRLRLPATTPPATVASIRESRDALLDALQDEAEDAIVSWPRAYQRWLVRTIGFALSEGFSKRESFWMSYRDIQAALEADRARVIAEAAEDGTLRAALDSGFVTLEQVAAGGAA
ncbi:MAG TPA: hypothetical protein DCK98_00155 [Chloroflexi bacterium]|jgi:hypothetical protein|nr:hypothetical protein [Chloroflexota bacterium]HAL28096.1 hypothetical protein [Chloroflexota bacterium]